MQKTDINTRICQLIFIIFFHDKKEKNFKKFTYLLHSRYVNQPLK